MKTGYALTLAIAAFTLAMTGSAEIATIRVLAQEQAPAPEPTLEVAPEPLNEDELEILVARIALYPDELVAAIVSASLYPLQIVEAQRFLDKYESDKSLQPSPQWDGSVISLLNYPQIVTMMSDDLAWTQSLGEAIGYQQKDVLVAIQQLRETAVAQGVIKTDDKVTVVEENNNIVIQPSQPDVIYIPQYEPAMFYQPGYVAAPIVYYPDPYPHYYDPIAPFFAGVVTGAIWGSTVDWDDWGVWGGNWDSDIDIDCKNCFNDVDFNGKVNINDVDWKKVDRSKIDIDKNQFTKIDNKQIKNGLKANERNSITEKTREAGKTRPSPTLSGGKQVTDVRSSTMEGLRAKPAGDTKAKFAAKPDVSPKANISKPSGGDMQKRPNDIDRPIGKPKPAAKPDTRPKELSPMGDKGRGKETQMQSDRGAKSMGGGAKPKSGGSGGSGHKQVKGGGGGKGGRR